MKKIIYTIMTAVLVALPMVLTACGDDNDEPKGSSKLEAELGYKLIVPEAVAKYYNITVSYTDSRGFTSSKQMPTTATNGMCTLEVIEPVSKFPAEVKISYNIELSGEKPTESTIDTFSSIETYAGVYDEKDVCVSGRTMMSSFGSKGLDVTSLDSYINAFNNTCKATTITVSADGKVNVQQ